MPFFDAKHLFSDGQEVTDSAYSSKEIDCGVAYPDLGEGEMLVVRFIIETAFTGGTNMAITLCHGAETAPTTQLVSVIAIAEASLTKGAYIPELKIPDQHLEFMRLYYTVSGTHSAGAITAFLDIASGMRHR